MSTVQDLPSLLMVSGETVCLAFMVLLALPKSRLRTRLLAGTGWPVMVCCASYFSLAEVASVGAVLGPLRVLADVGVAVLGITAASVVIHAGDESWTKT